MLEAAEIVMDHNGMSVPYDPKIRRHPVLPGVSHNHGFVDTRNRPDVAAAIPEGSQSVAFKALLVALAQPESEWFSVGCDLGSADSITASELELPPGKYAGGYIQVLETDYADYLVQDHYERFAEIVEAELREKSGDDHWYMACVLTWVRFELDDYNDLVLSLSIWFDAHADSDAAALRSRERLIAALHQVLQVDQ